MIRSFIHKGLKGYFTGSSSLPASLMEHEEGLRYWLSIMNAVTKPGDLKLAGAKLIKSNPGYRLTVDQLGEFSFLLKDGNIESLNFKQK